MSPWSADAVTLAVAPGALALVRPRSGKKEQLQGDTRDPLPLLARLEPLFAKPEWKTGQLNVVFSHKLARHALTAPPGKTLSEAEEAAFARAALTEVYGEEAAGWRVRALSQPPACGVLGVALDEALCAALEAAGARHGWRARLRPLAAALPEPAGAARAAAWFVVEPGWGTLFLGAPGRWVHVAGRALDANWAGALPDWLARAAEQHSVKPGVALVQSVGVAGATPPALAGWQWRMTQAAVGESGALALAMGCA